MIPVMKTHVISVRTGGRETVLDITADCADFASTAADGGDGLLHVFVPHATAGVALLELGAGSDGDLLAALAALLPAGRYARVPGGHGDAFTAPEFAAAITAFLTEEREP